MNPVTINEPSNNDTSYKCRELSVTYLTFTGSGAVLTAFGANNKEVALRTDKALDDLSWSNFVDDLKFHWVM